jgi:hypothetical protein
MILAADTIWTGLSGVVIAILVIWGIWRWRGH